MVCIKTTSNSSPVNIIKSEDFSQSYLYLIESYTLNNEITVMKKKIIIKRERERDHKLNLNKLYYTWSSKTDVEYLTEVPKFYLLQITFPSTNMKLSPIPIILVASLPEQWSAPIWTQLKLWHYRIFLSFFISKKENNTSPPQTLTQNFTAPVWVSSKWLEPKPSYINQRFELQTPRISFLSWMIQEKNL